MYRQSSILIGLTALAAFACWGGCPPTQSDNGNANDNSSANTNDNGSSDNTNTNDNTDGGTPALEPLVKQELAVAVVPPAGVAMPASVKTSLGSASVASGVAAQTPVFNEGPQFAIATDAAGNPQLMGFVGPGAAELNTHTTAEVLLFFGLNAPLLPGAAQEKVLAELKQHAAIQPLADAIAAALAADPLALVNKDTSIRTALHAARAQIMDEAKSATSGTARVLIDPSDGQSGLTVLQDGLNSITIRNDFRRRAYYFVEALSYVPEGGGAPIESHLDVTEGDISPTAGATSVFGAINDIVTGTQAYVGVVSGAIDMPILPQSAESTTYRVTVVGIGAHAGSENSLTEAQTSKKREIIVKSFVVDFFVPYFVDIIIPIYGKRIDDVLNRDHASDVLAGLISAVGNAAPHAYDRVQAGDLTGAMYDLFTNVASDGSARLAVLQGLYLLVSQFGSFASQENFTQFGAEVLSGIDLVDSILIGFDSRIQVEQITQSDRAVTWKVVSDRSKVKLTPPKADLDELHSQVFRADIPDATGSDAVIVYRWKSTAQHGDIRDNQHQGAEFESSENVVTYFPRIPVSPGEDTITVEAFEVQGQNRISLGTATATAKVRELIPKITPDRTSLVRNESQTFTVAVDSLLAGGGTLTYKWFSTNKFGQITQPPPLVESTTNTATYTATGNPPGEDTVAVEVFTTREGVKTSLGIARAQVKIEERKTIIFGKFDVVVQFAQPGFTGTPGFQFVTAYAQIPKVEGATSYSARIYNFYDGAYWGHGTVFGDATVRGAEDRGNEYWIGLTGGQAREADVSASVAAAASRFVGIIVEVTVTY